VVKDGEVGCLVEVGDVAGMADCLKQLLSDAIRCKEMGKRARKWVQDEFSTRKLAEKMEAIYRELLNRKSK